MPVAFFALFIGLPLILGIAAFASGIQDDKPVRTRIGIILIGIAIGFSSWLGISAIDLFQVKEWFICEVQTTESKHGTIQFIVVNDKFINLNQKYNKVLPEGTMIKVTIYEKYYLGIYYMDLMSNDYEIVEPGIMPQPMEGP